MFTLVILTRAAPAPVEAPPDPARPPTARYDPSAELRTVAREMIGADIGGYYRPGPRPYALAYDHVIWARRIERAVEALDACGGGGRR